MVKRQGKVLEVFTQADIPLASQELLSDRRITAIAARGCFKAIPAWQNWAYRDQTATHWINTLPACSETTEVLRNWLTRHYHKTIFGMLSGWHHDKQARGGIVPHIDYLRYGKMVDVVGGLSMSVCREGEGVFFAERLQPTGWRRLLSAERVPSVEDWNAMNNRIPELFTVPFGTPIEHEAGDAIVFAGYPIMTVHAVTVNGTTKHEDTGGRVAELFDHHLVVPHTFPAAA